MYIVSSCIISNAIHTSYQAWDLQDANSPTKNAWNSQHMHGYDEHGMEIVQMPDKLSDAEKWIYRYCKTHTEQSKVANKL